jgi:DNA-binding response OmpR family regulator
MKILVADDDLELLGLVAFALRQAGYLTVEAPDGPSALAAFARERPDLVVLDVMLPRLDGLQVMALLRQRRSVPVILLTARGDEPDRIAGLKLGADDYVAKPFSPAELVARVGAVLRRSAEQGAAAADEVLRFGDVEVDVAARTVTVGGTPVELTAKELDLLVFLARSPGRAFTRDELMRAVWRYPYYANTATLTVHVRRLRGKIERDPLAPRHLVTVWGVGYRLDP